MLDFRTLKEGEGLDFSSYDFDGHSEVHGRVTEIGKDHAIMTGENGARYWVDEDTAYQFKRA